MLLISLACGMEISLLQVHAATDSLPGNFA